MPPHNSFQYGLSKDRSNYKFSTEDTGGKRWAIIFKRAIGRPGRDVWISGSGHLGEQISKKIDAFIARICENKGVSIE